MTAAVGSILLLGIGNVLLRDEGVGVAVARAISEDAATGEGGLPAGTLVVDGGTLGLDLLPMLEDARAAVLVDAVNLRQPAGTVAVLRDDAIHVALERHVSPHQVGIGDLLGAARLAGKLSKPVALVGVQPGSIEVGLELTPEVAAAVPRAAEACRDLLRSFAALPGATA